MATTSALTRNAPLYRNLVRREVRQRYKGSALGLGWTLLAHMAQVARSLGFARLRSIESHANHAALEVERALGFTTSEYEGDATMVLVEKALG